jgi:hypothetical protein
VKPKAANWQGVRSHLPAHAPAGGTGAPLPATELARPQQSVHWSWDRRLLSSISAPLDQDMQRLESDPPELPG